MNELSRNLDPLTEEKRNHALAVWEYEERLTMMRWAAVLAFAAGCFFGWLLWEIVKGGGS